MFKQAGSLVIEWDRMSHKRRAEHQVEDRWIINRLVKRVNESFEVWGSILSLIINFSIHFSIQLRRCNDLSLTINNKHDFFN